MKVILAARGRKQIQVNHMKSTRNLASAAFSPPPIDMGSILEQGLMKELMKFYDRLTI